MTIRKLKPAKISETISVFDIETASDGSLLDLGFRHENNYKTFNTWLGFINYLAENVRIEGQSPITTIWAHKGGGFDTVALVLELTRNSYYQKIIKQPTALLSNGSILQLFITFLHNDETINIQDSFMLFPMSLKKLLEGFGLANKHDVPSDYISHMEDYKKEHTKEYYAYLQQDCDGLYNALMLFRNIVNEHIAPLGNLSLSLGSMSLKAYRTIYMEDEIYTPNKDVQDFCAQAYAGGRTEFFGNGKKSQDGLYHNCNYYDVNSMYPAEMLNGIFPFGAPVFTKKLYYNDEGILIPGAYEIEYNQIGGHIPLLRDQSSGKKSKEHEFIGKGIYTSDEILYLQKIGADIKIIKGLCYPESKPIFKKFVEKIYAIRLDARKNNNSALDLICKLFLNNLYGKFSQREEGESLAFLTSDEIDILLYNIENKIEEKIFEVSFLINNEDDNCNEAGLYPVILKQRVEVQHRHVLIGALITARCRIKITGLAEKYHTSAIYCDTDSFITQEILPPELVDSNILGMLKMEHENVTMEFFGRKQYRIIETGELKQKGVMIVKSEIERFCLEVKAEGYIAPYKSPSGIKTAIKKGHINPNEFKDYTRKINSDQSSKENNKIR